MACVQTTVYRPWFGRVLVAGIAAICAVSAVVTLWREGVGALLRVAPWLALVAGSCWAVFWRPRVEVSDGDVRLVNVLRTIDVPWPAIEEVETRWALTLVTAYGTFKAWAAPAPGVVAAARATRSDVRHLPASTDGGEGVGLGDLPTGPSGEAAVVVRRHWDQLRAAGYLDNPRLEHERVPVRWHTETLAVGAVLLALGVVGLVV